MALIGFSRRSDARASLSVIPANGPDSTATPGEPGIYRIFHHRIPQNYGKAGTHMQRLANLREARKMPGEQGFRAFSAVGDLL
jgi:hypothetical protein